MFYLSHVQVQLINTYENKIYSHNLVIEDFREKKIELLEIGPFRKMAKTLFCIEVINLIFCTNFHDIKG